MIPDLIIILLCLYAFSRGWRLGLFRTLLGPISLLIATVLSYWIYFTTRNLLLSLSVGLIGPFIINGILSICWKIILGMIVIDKDSRSPLGSLCGGFLNTLWTAFIVLLVVVCTLILPESLPGVDRAQAFLKNSFTYRLISPYTQMITERRSSDTQPGLFQPNPAILETEEYHAIMEDDGFKDIFNDPEIIKYVEEKNFAKLMSHPKILQLTQDKELMEKMMKLYGKAFQKPPPPSSPASSGQDLTTK